MRSAFLPVNTVAVLPVDDRPVNYDYPRYLGRAAALDVRLPPREWLGNPWRPSRHDDLVAWLRATAASAGALVVSIDTLGYGGLIPSRQSTEPAAAVLARLGVLRELKAARPDLSILASSVILRIHRSDSSEEEKPYWATCGRRMFRLSFLEHKAELGAASTDETAERDRLRAEIPGTIYADYRAGRARNHAINAAMLDWAADGFFDFLILPQDDTADYGWNIAEARRLDAAIRARGLTDRAITYPGADEIGCLLLARHVCRRAGFAPRVHARYATAAGPTVITDYEDRPLHALLQAHLTPLGGQIVDAPADANLDLWFNSPARRQGNSESQWLVRRGVEPVRASLPASGRPWLDEVVSGDGFRTTREEIAARAPDLAPCTDALLAAVRSGSTVAVADVAFVNAADSAFCERLCPHREIASLAAFGGWNTAGNTLGAVLAQAVIRTIALRDGATRDQLAAQLEFLFLRFVDDYLYQAGERIRCMVEDLPALGLAPTMERLPDDRAPLVAASVGVHLAEASAPLRDVFISSGLVRDVRITDVHLPWQRLFEVGFAVSVDLA
ncbi:MAG TPA: DUF4127 family protein [Opitutus sp.]|nr:DUF4127 family protein [Opitutus sp.]